MNNPELPIVIVGAGVGGLSAAIRLAAAGMPVIVLEKNDLPGGKMREIRIDGYRWDTGPSVITMRHVLDDLFRSVGHRLDDYIDLQPVQPLTRYFYADGTLLDASSDPMQMAEAVAVVARNDVDGYKAYLAYAEQIYQITAPVFIYDHPPTLRSFLRVPSTEWLKVDPFRTMRGAIEAYVQSTRLRQLLSRFATYVGGDPYKAPATLNVIAHVELNGGVWYPHGGVYQIAASMARLAQKLGVRLLLNQPVKAITVQQDRITGVELADGSTIATNCVISNVDVTTTFKHLLPQTNSVRKRLKQLSRFAPSCSGFVMLLGIEGKDERLAHHNILFSEDSRAEFDAIFKHQVPADDPTVYIAITSKTDPDHAPHNGENWFVLVNAPALSASYDWQTKAQAYRNRILDVLAHRGFDVRSRVQAERFLTPEDMQQMTAAWRGALYGPSPNSHWAAFRRPHNRSNVIKGLYFVGGTTHPGGGVPLATLSGKVVAEMVLADMMK